MTLYEVLQLEYTKQKAYKFAFVRLQLQLKTRQRKRLAEVHCNRTCHINCLTIFDVQLYGISSSKKRKQVLLLACAS